MKRALLILALLAAPAHAGIVLEASTDTLELVTSTSASLDYNCSFTDSTTSAFTPGKSAGNVASATTTTVVAAPATSTQRNILNCTFRNASTSTANALTLQRDVSGSNRTMFAASLAPGEVLQLTQAGEFQVLSSSGALRTQSVDSGYDGRAYYIAKGGTAIRGILGGIGAAAGAFDHHIAHFERGVLNQGLQGCIAGPRMHCDTCATLRCHPSEC